MNNDTDLQVTIDAELFWREKSGSTQEQMLRKQQNVRLRAIAAQFEGPLKELIKIALSAPEGLADD